MIADVRVVHSTIDDLARDLRQLPPKIARDSIKTVRDGARVGAMLAKQNAKETSGRHGKHFPASISSEVNGPVGFGGVMGYSAEYGPDRNHAGGQGNMEFEEGSRNQRRPHRAMGRTIPMVRPAFYGEFSRKIDGWFW